MDKMAKKIVAREWLYFLLFLCIGIVIVPILLHLIFTGSVKGLGSFYLALIGQETDSLFAWIITIGPYVLFQLIRSIVWAWKQLKHL